ncbi:MAG: hypothetical protein P8X87_07235 [Candidatus Bathyarchaeota archaeon]
MSADIRKLKKLTSKVAIKIEKIHNHSHDSSLRVHPAELAEVRNVLKVASKTLGGNKIYYENHIEKAGFSSFHLSDSLDVLGNILEIIEKRIQRTISRKKRVTASKNQS